MFRVLSSGGEGRESCSIPPIINLSKNFISEKALSKRSRMMLVSALQHLPVRSKKDTKYAPCKCTGMVKVVTHTA